MEFEHFRGIHPLTFIPGLKGAGVGIREGREGKEVGELLGTVGSILGSSEGFRVGEGGFIG